MTIRENIRDEEWDEFVKSNNECNIFHSLEWEKLLKKEYRFNIKRVCGIDENGKLISCVQFCEKKDKFVALPFSDYYNIISDKKEQSKLLIDEILKISGKNRDVLIKSLVDDDRFIKRQEEVIHFGYYNRNFDEISKEFDDMHIRGVKKAAKSGLVAKIDRRLEGVKKYYDLHLLTRKRQGVPIQPYSFFMNLHSEVINKGLGLVCLIYLDDKAIAGGVFLHFNNTFTYKFGASDFKYLNARPNNLMFYEMIKYAIGNGFTIFDFGKTDMENEGLRKFKTGWGAIEKPLFYSYYPEYKKNKVFIFLKDKIVAPVIKFSPKFVCRGIGEVFYKYVG